MYEVVRHEGPGAFLERAEAWLLVEEDRHNLILSLSYGGVRTGDTDDDAFFGTVEDGGIVVGCAIRTPPHKLLVTELPTVAADALAQALAPLYAEIPGVLGPPDVAEAIAMAWVGHKGGGWRPGLEQRIYRLDVVTPAGEVTGSLRAATEADVDLAIEWGAGFARDSGAGFPTRRESVERWVRDAALYIWQDGEPRSICVAHGRTPNGTRIGYVYTPPEWRGRGYASACVAEVSQRMLDSGLAFCVLYTDLSNPTSNAIYQRLGYEPIADVRDFDLIAEGLS